MKSNPKVSIIILNWNGWEDTIECLESVKLNDYNNYNVVIVDNNSTDDSVSKIREYLQGHITIKSPFFFDQDKQYTRYCELSEESIETYEINDSSIQFYLVINNDNYGFAKGNNIGIKFALHSLDPDYIMLLNNDTVVDRTFLSNIMGNKSMKDLAVFGPVNYNYYKCMELGSYMGLISKWTGIISINKKLPELAFEPVDFITGTCIGFSSSLLKNIGLLDEKFFFGGGEDIDICLRASNQGYQILVFRDSIIYHKGEERIKSANANLYLYYIPRNYFIIISRHWSKLQLITTFYFQLFYSYHYFIRIVKYYRGSNLLNLFVGILGEIVASLSEK